VPIFSADAAPVVAAQMGNLTAGELKRGHG
jgi:hypothetical protein